MYLILLILGVIPLFAANFVLLTQPKTGTHLVEPILRELTGKVPYSPREFIKKRSYGNTDTLNEMFLEEGCLCPNRIVEEIWRKNGDQGSFLLLHTPYSKEFENYLMKNQTVVFFVQRDPRDQIVSLLNHYKKFGYLNKEVEKIDSDDEQLFYMIRNHMKRNFLLFKGWLNSPIVCVLDFSKLMGAHGGAATEEDAIGELRKIASVLGLNLSDDELIEIYAKHFGKGEIFFKGKVGSWRDYFSERHKREAKRQVGPLLIELGYEKDRYW